MTRTKHATHTERSDPQCIACRRENLVELAEHETRQEATMPRLIRSVPEAPH